MKPEVISEIEEIVSKLIDNQNERLAITDLMAKEISYLLVNCQQNNISNIVISTKRIYYVKKNPDSKVDHQLKMPQWKMSINDNLNNTLLCNEAKNSDLRKINDIEKVSQYGNIEND